MLLFLTGCMTMDSFFFANTQVDAYDLSSDVIPSEEIEEVSWEGKAGQLYGVWAHQPDPGAPVLVYFHGNSEHLGSYMEWVEEYWSWGYETFIFDYRGFGRSEGTPDYQGVIDDGASAVQFIEGSSGVAIADQLWLGLSLGGFCAVQNADALPPKVLITEAMFASADHLADAGMGQDVPPGWFFKDPFDNVDAASKVHVPYLVMHGIVDDYIEITNAEEVYAAANEPKLLWEVPGANHDDIHEVDPEGYRQHIDCWLAQNCE